MKNNSSAFESGENELVSDSAFELGAEESSSAADCNSSIKLAHQNAFSLVGDDGKTYWLYDEELLEHQGAMGTVSKAILQLKSNAPGEKVLIKRLPKGLTNSNSLELFIKESNLSCSDNGPNVVKGYFKGETDDFCFVVLQFYEGQNLKELIDTINFKDNLDELNNVFRGILEGLRDLHRNSIIHRDIKPENIIMRNNGEPVIIDLGLALYENVADLKGLKKIGTPRYAAPEQQNGGHISYAADIYGVGKILCEMLTGDVDVGCLDELSQEYSDYTSFIKKCCDKDPAKRFKTGRQALDAFNQMFYVIRTGTGQFTTVHAEDETQYALQLLESEDKLKDEFFKRYGDDGIIDDDEMNQLKRIAAILKLDDESFKNVQSEVENSILKYKRKILTSVLKQNSTSKQQLISLGKKLHIASDVVQKWIKISEEFVVAVANNDSNKMCEIIKCMGFKREDIDIIRRALHNDSSEKSKSAASTEQTKPEKKNEESATCGCIMILFIIAAIAGAVYYFFFRESLDDNYKKHSYELIKDKRDGQEYRVIKIGGKKWIAENIRYNAPESYCFDCEKFGRLYTWDQAFTACPEGFRLPRKHEWDVLIAAAGGKDVAAKKLKGTVGWGKDGGAGTNDLGFAAIPAGFFSANDKVHKNADEYARWWIGEKTNSKNGMRVRMNRDSDQVETDGGNLSVNYGLSVRCVEGVSDYLALYDLQTTQKDEGKIKSMNLNHIEKNSGENWGWIDINITSSWGSFNFIWPEIFENHSYIDIVNNDEDLYSLVSTTFQNSAKIWLSTGRKIKREDTILPMLLRKGNSPDTLNVLVKRKVDVTGVLDIQSVSKEHLENSPYSLASVTLKNKKKLSFLVNAEQEKLLMNGLAYDFTPLTFHVYNL